MSPTPEKARKCRSRSSFPGEESYRCVVRGEHVMHTDGRHHNWFDAIPDLPISAYQADFLEQFGVLGFDGSRTADAVVRMAQRAPRGFVPSGHQNTDRVLREQAERNARAFDDLRLTELQRQINEDIARIAAVTDMPHYHVPYEEPVESTVADLTAELRRLDHEIAAVRMRPVRFPLSEAHLRERRERVRKAREKRAKREEWYEDFAPRYAYGTNSPRAVSSAEAFAAAEAPRLAHFEAIRAGFKSALYPAMKAAWRGVEPEHDLHLPKVEYVYREGTEILVPSDPEAAKVDHVMTRNGGEIFGIARVSKEPIPDGTTIRTQETKDLRIDPYWQDPTPLSAEAMAKIIGSGEVRTTSSTGGEKGMKPARFDLIPVMPLTKLAEHFGVGAAKYADHNWRKGYEISKNYAALQRHVTAFWNGEDLDPETGTSHLSAVIFHAMAMQQTLEDFPQHDDRYKA